MQVVIGKKLARQLEVNPGDKLIFIDQTVDGYMANNRDEILGILKMLFYSNSFNSRILHCIGGIIQCMI